MKKQEPRYKQPFRMLCIDGGGIRGMYSAQVLAGLEETYQTLVSNHFDLICGTSTGGIIALAASLKIPMKEIVKFYQQYGPFIFNQKYHNTCIGQFLLGVKQAIHKCKYEQKKSTNRIRICF